MFGKYVVDQNGRVLTAKYIELEPYPWLEKLEKSSKKIALNLCWCLTANYRGEMTKKIGVL